MEYVSLAPEPPLDRFVDDLYCLFGKPRHRRMSVPPMPSAHLYLNFGGPLVLHDSDPAVPSASMPDGWFMGVWTRRFTVEYPDAVHVVGVHFKPWGASPFLGVPASELQNAWAPVDDLWRRSLDTIRNRVGEADGPLESLRALEVELLARLAAAPPRGLALVQHTARHLAAADGAISIAALANAAGVSGNHLTDQFRSHIGVTPKRVARIYRFARLILSVDARLPVDWSALALRAGYFDQAHFGKEFKDFTGCTPTQFLALRRRLPAEPDFPPDAGPMPAD